MSKFEEKKCHKCAMLIPKKAEVCPYCLNPQGWTKAAKLFLAFIVLFIIAISVGQNSLNQAAKSPERIADQTELTPAGSAMKQLHPDWANKACNAVAERKIHIGMTDEQVEIAWGKPYKINNTQTANSSSEQWVMHEGIGSDYLYFNNGILISVQQSK